MRKYSYCRKRITPLQMLWLLIRSWFTSPPLALGCLIIIFLGPLYLLVVFLQIILFLPVLPVIILVYLPLSLTLYSKPEKNWAFWTAAYTVCAILLSITPAMFFYQVEGVLFTLGAFVILSGMCGMCAYFKLYNAGNMEMLVENKNGKT